MDIGASHIVGQIASSSTSALSAYAPVFLLVGGIVLALVIIERVITVFFVKDEQRDTI